MMYSTSTIRNSLKLKAVQRELVVTVPPMIAEAADEVLKRSLKNLSGGRYLPGTLPVRLVTGYLRRSMRRLMLSRFAHAVFSDERIANYNKYVHDGTRNMRPRRFLGDVISERRASIQNKLRRQIIIAIRRVGRA